MQRGHEPEESSKEERLLCAYGLQILARHEQLVERVWRMAVATVGLCKSPDAMQRMVERLVMDRAIIRGNGTVRRGPRFDDCCRQALVSLSDDAVTWALQEARQLIGAAHLLAACEELPDA